MAKCRPALALAYDDIWRDLRRLRSYKTATFPWFCSPLRKGTMGRRHKQTHRNVNIVSAEIMEYVESSACSAHMQGGRAPSTSGPQDFHPLSSYKKPPASSRPLTTTVLSNPHCSVLAAGWKPLYIGGGKLRDLIEVLGCASRLLRGLCWLAPVVLISLFFMAFALPGG